MRHKIESQVYLFREVGSVDIESFSPAPALWPSARSAADVQPPSSRRCPEALSSRASRRRPRPESCTSKSSRWRSADTRTPKEW